MPLAAAGSIAALWLLLSIPALVSAPARWLDGLFSYAGWLATCAALGAAGGGLLLAPQFGLPGARGALRSTGAYLAAVFSGGLIGGTLAFPLFGTLYGPWMIVALSFAQPPNSLLLLLPHPLIVFAMHLAGRRRRRLLAICAPPPTRPLTRWLVAAAIYAAAAILLY